VIVLKEAKIDDHWNTFIRRDYPVKLNELRILDHEVFEKQSFKLLGGVNIFVGRNGVGKSNLMRLLYNCLIAEESNRIAFTTPIISKAKIELDFQVGVHKATRNSSIALDELMDARVTSFMFDPCTLIPLLQQMLSEQSNFLELIEQHGQNSANEEELKLINYLTGNDYSKIVITTIEGEFDNYPAFPYFSVKLGDIEYDSSSMGMGELSLFYFWWLVSYMEHVDGHKILLVEEPESFLPPASQKRLANLVAMTCATQGFSLVLSTHSEHILSRMPSTTMHLLLRSENGVSIYPVSGGTVSHIESLGLMVPKLGMLFLEDVGGIIFAKSLFNKTKEFSVSNFYYHNSGSESEITTDIRRLSPAQKGWLFAGLYDGDCRTKKIAVPRDGKHFFLPGDKPPDELMMTYFKSKSSSEIARLMMRSETLVIQAKATATGSDFHDYFHLVGGVLGMDFNRMFSFVCDLWIDDNNAALEAFSKEASHALFSLKT
jgi:ABC-type transport system involved in cytochrome c biogenesis ATPase subunit